MTCARGKGRCSRNDRSITPAPIIATIIRDRRANDIHMLNYFEALNTDEGDQLDHADRIVSAKLVMNVMEDMGFNGNVKVYVYAHGQWKAG